MLAAYKTSDASKFLTRLADSGLGRNSISHIRSLLSGIMSHALNLGVIDRNPLEGAKVLSKVKQPVDTESYSLREVEDMISALEGESDCRLLVGLCGLLGLRPSEATALGWDCVDLESGRDSSSARIRARRARRSQDGRLGADSPAHRARWDLSGGRITMRIPGGKNCRDLLVVDSAHVLATFGEERTALLHIPSGTERWSVPWWADNTGKWSLSEFPRRLAVAVAQDVGVFEMIDGRCVAEFSADSPIDFCEITPDANKLVCVDAVGGFHILEVQ